MCKQCDFSPIRFARAESVREMLLRIADARGGVALGKLRKMLLAAGDDWTRADIDATLDHLARKGWAVLGVDENGTVRVQLHTPSWARPRRELEACPA